MNSNPMMKVEKGEEIAMMCISQAIPNHGYYKFLAKKKINDTFEWIHFNERFDKRKENVYQGHVESPEKLLMVLDIMNRNLVKTFGPNAEMKNGKADIATVHGKMDGATD